MAFAVHVPLLVLVLVLAMVGGLAAGNFGNTCSSSCFAVAGRKFKLQNRPLQAGLGDACPEGSPSSTVAFCNPPGNRVKIVGNFVAADFGVCLAADAMITYEQYGDTVVLRVVGRVPAAFRVLEVQREQLGLGISGQRYGVSTFLDDGPARC